MIILTAAVLNMLCDKRLKTTNMETQKIPYSSGKIIFTSPEHAVQVQSDLLKRGYKFSHGAQAPRLNAYGCMWRDGEIRCAGNRNGFAGYGVPLSNLYQEKSVVRVINRDDLKQRQREQGIKAAAASKEQAKQRKTDLIVVVAQAMHDIGQHRSNLHITQSRSQARIAAWKALVKRCLELDKSAEYANSLRLAIRDVMDQQRATYMMPDNRMFYRIIREAK